jgi:hypothetical protein
MRKLALFLAVPLILLTADAAYAGSVTAPSITTQPANATVAVGKAATYSVVASGSTPLKYQWYKNASAISGATKSSYTTPVTTTQDSYAYGVYFYVVVSNSAGSVNSNSAMLTVIAPPTIEQQPASITVTAPAIATFDVEADGTWPLKYQWYKNGAAISGATDEEYSVQETSAADNGAKFTVKVTNSAGSVTSKAAVLTVKTAAAGTYPIVGNWAGTAKIVGADGSTTNSKITASFAQNAYSITATVAFTDDNGDTEYGAGIASLNTLNVYSTVGGDEDGIVNIAGAFDSTKFTFNGTGVGSDGSGGTGAFTISTDKKTLTGNAVDSFGDSITYTLKRK